MHTRDKGRLPVAAVFIDGQNLFHAARESFGISNHDVDALARKICEKKGWEVGAINFYSGIPSKEHDPSAFERWDKRIAVMKQQGVNVVSRELAYRKKKVFGPNGQETISLHAGEKGIDVRLALDVARAAYERSADVFVIFSQDQDLLEACLEVKRISSEQKRAVRICSVFPLTSASHNTRGIRDVEAIGIDQATYNQCLDPRQYYRSKEECLAFGKPKEIPAEKPNSAKAEFAATQAKFAAMANRIIGDFAKPAGDEPQERQRSNHDRQNRDRKQTKVIA